MGLSRSLAGDSDFGSATYTRDGTSTQYSCCAVWFALLAAPNERVCWVEISMLLAQSRCICRCSGRDRQTYPLQQLRHANHFHTAHAIATRQQQQQLLGTASPTAAGAAIIAATAAACSLYATLLAPAACAEQALLSSPLGEPDALVPPATASCGQACTERLQRLTELSVQLPPLPQEFPPLPDLQPPTMDMVGPALTWCSLCGPQVSLSLGWPLQHSGLTLRVYGCGSSTDDNASHTQVLADCTHVMMRTALLQTNSTPAAPNPASVTGP